MVKESQLAPLVFCMVLILAMNAHLPTLDAQSPTLPQTPQPSPRDKSTSCEEGLESGLLVATVPDTPRRLPGSESDHNSGCWSWRVEG